jgi:hypothetical protein
MKQDQKDAKAQAKTASASDTLDSANVSIGREG